MKLEGYRCDNCGTESYEKQGDWFEIVQARVTHGAAQRGRINERFPHFEQTWGASFSPPKHFCSPQCIAAHAAQYEREG